MFPTGEEKEKNTRANRPSWIWNQYTHGRSAPTMWATGMTITNMHLLNVHSAQRGGCCTILCILFFPFSQSQYIPVITLHSWHKKSWREFMPIVFPQSRVSNALWTENSRISWALCSPACVKSDLEVCSAALHKRTSTLQRLYRAALQDFLLLGFPLAYNHILTWHTCRWKKSLQSAAAGLKKKKERRKK